MSERPAVVALDVGDIVIRGALFGADATIQTDVRRPTGRAEGADALVEKIVGVATEAHGGGTAGAVGVGLSPLGLVDATLRDALTSRLGLPVGIAPDARSAAMAEGWGGQAQGVSDYLYLGLGSAVSAAYVSGASPLLGAHSLAGSLGHVIVQPNGRPCSCGARGCLDTVAGSAAMAALYREAIGTAIEVAGDDIVRRGSAGDDPAATSIWQAALAGLSSALVTAITLYDPELIIIGGPLARADQALFAPLLGELGARLTWQPMPRVLPSGLGDNAVIYGAALLAWQAWMAAQPAPSA